MIEYIKDMWTCFLGLGMLVGFIFLMLASAGFVMFGLHLLANGGQP